MPHYDIGNNPEQEWVIKVIVDHKWSPNLVFKVQWQYGDSTWEPLHMVNALEVLDHYLKLEGATEPLLLHHK